MHNRSIQEFFIQTNTTMGRIVYKTIALLTLLSMFMACNTQEQNQEAPSETPTFIQADSQPSQPQANEEDSSSPEAEPIRLIEETEVETP